MKNVNTGLIYKDSSVVDRFSIIENKNICPNIFILHKLAQLGLVMKLYFRIILENCGNQNGLTYFHNQDEWG